MYLKTIKFIFNFMLYVLDVKKNNVKKKKIVAMEVFIDNYFEQIILDNKYPIPYKRYKFLVWTISVSK